MFNGYRISVWEDEQVLEMSDGNGCTTVNVLNVFNAIEVFTLRDGKFFVMFYHNKKVNNK